MTTVVAVLAMAGFWIWILSGGPRRANPDRVSDRSLIAADHDRCKAAVKAISALPPATESRTATARAVVVDRATTILDRLIDHIQNTSPRSGKNAVRMRGWTRDWRTYLRDRRRYTERLRRDPRARFLLDVNPAGDSVDRVIKNFADINDMPSCATPGDVG